MSDTADRLNRLITLAGEFPAAQRRTLLLQLSELLHSNARAYADEERRALDAVIGRVAATLEPAGRQATPDDEENLVALLRAGRMEEFLACFALLTGLDADCARDALNGKGGSDFAAACRKAGFQRSAYSALVLLSDPKNLRSPKKTQALLWLYDEAARALEARPAHQAA
jgi:uncharacterized protein (DUF2336 family)